MVNNQILTVKEMYELDAVTMSMGVPGIQLMENAGYAVVEEICKRWSRCNVSVLCGPGNNGGDGFVIARLLREAGYTIRLGLLGSISQLKGDAAMAAKKWNSKPERLEVDILDNSNLVIDAIFGAGLNRYLSAELMTIVDKVNELDVPCVSVDVPSGVHGDNGQVLGSAIQANICVTFCRRKPAHLLVPGRTLAGETIVANIGIPEVAVSKMPKNTSENTPSEWLSNYPWPKINEHKYNRGHALVMGGEAIKSGAARLGAKAALRIGAGLVTILAPNPSLDIYASQLTAIMLGSLLDLESHLDDKRKNAVLVGPGFGVGAGTRDIIFKILRTGKICVLDADALTSFDNYSTELFNSIHSKVVLTPHHGEFVGLFGVNKKHNISKVEQAREAAECSGAIVIYKGPDTVIAAPDGRVVINTNASPHLATAGSGDVLAGFVLGLAAQGMELFEASSAAVWLHGEISRKFGPGLISEDLADALPTELNLLRYLGQAID